MLIAAFVLVEAGCPGGTARVRDAGAGAIKNNCGSMRTCGGPPDRESRDFCRPCAQSERCAPDGSCVAPLACASCANDDAVSIPAGDVLLAPGRSPRRTGAFRLDRHEVTNSQYAACVDTGTCIGPDQRPTIDELVVPVVGPQTGALRDEAFSRFPVTGVTPGDAEAYCGWRGGRLPTAVEWWRAWVGGCELRGSPECDEADVLTQPPMAGTSDRCLQVNAGFRCPAEGIGDTCACNGGPVDVGTSPGDVSPYGVVDMSGNVQEIVFAGDERICQEGASYPVFGGNYLHIIEAAAWDDTVFCNARDEVSAARGFRCAYDE